jgi:hypothetical protein
LFVGMNGLSTMHTNLLTDVQSLTDARYDSIEILVTKLERYLDAGYRVEELLPALGCLQVNMIGALDQGIIESVHISDSIQRKGPKWRNDPREALPGDGVVPLAEGIAAVRATGYDRIWTAEIYSFYHSEWPVSVLAQEVKRRMDDLLGREKSVA